MNSEIRKYNAKQIFQIQPFALGVRSPNLQMSQTIKCHMKISVQKNSVDAQLFSCDLKTSRDAFEAELILIDGEIKSFLLHDQSQVRVNI